MAIGNGMDGGQPGRVPAESPLRRLYRLQAARERRVAKATASRASTPLVIGFSVFVAFIGVSIVSVLLAFQAAAAGYESLTKNLPALSNINNRATFKTAQIFDRKGQLLWEFYDPDGGRRTVVPLSEVSQRLIDATLAAEDAYFYQHQGVDPRATLRSAFFFSSGDNRGGASTINQQLVRNVLLDPKEAKQVTPQRKLREIILAYQLDQKLSKDQILEMYLNEVFYGNQSYGIEAAAQSYFDKSARDLDIAEASLLAGLVQSPSAYDPTRRDLPRTADGIPVPTKERQAYVLEQMTRQGFITEQQARDAYAEPLRIKQRTVELKEPHWVMYVRDLVEQKYGSKTLYQGGLKIYTTLDADYSAKMRDVLANARDNIQANGGNNSALISINPKTGEILAFDGSLDYNDVNIDGQVNVLLNERQPGSSIKPLVYSAAFLKGWAPGTFVNDAPTCWQPGPGQNWCPVNFDNAFHGQTTLRSALGNSLNIPAVKTLEFAGVDFVVELGRKMGVSTWQEDSAKTFGLSLTLGGAEVKPIDLAQIYGTFANNGLKIPLVAITRIVDSDGNILEDYKVPQGEQVIDPRAAYMITNILSDPTAKLFTYGPSTPLVLRQGTEPSSPVWPSASKTGTTDNYRDTWTAGFTPNLAIVVWVGNTGGAPMRPVLSSMTAGKIWPEAMKTSFEYLGLKPEDFPRPEGLVEQQVCGDQAMRPGQPACRSDLFFAEKAPRAPVGQAPAPRPTSAPTPAPAAPAPAVPAPPAAPAPPLNQDRQRLEPTAVPQPAPAPPRPAATQAPQPPPAPAPAPAVQPTQAPAPAPTRAPAPAAPAPTAAPKPGAVQPAPAPKPASP
ncbi:MAG: transglycosylase domain-containing protein [Chloroflexi bacterium]|nr:transglycosylase domain-containing protein [Chloroflexota bacterium]